MLKWCASAINPYKPENKADFEIIKQHWIYILNLTNAMLSQDRKVCEDRLKDDPYADWLKFNISDTVYFTTYCPTLIHVDRAFIDDKRPHLSVYFELVISDYEELSDGFCVDIGIFANEIKMFSDIPEYAFENHQSELKKIKEWVSELEDYCKTVNKFDYSGLNLRVKSMQKKIDDQQKYLDRYTTLNTLIPQTAISFLSKYMAVRTSDKIYSFMFEDEKFYGKLSVEISDSSISSDPYVCFNIYSNDYDCIYEFLGIKFPLELDFDLIYDYLPAFTSIIEDAFKAMNLVYKDIEKEFQTN